MAKPFDNVVIPPGLVAGATPYENSGRWFSGHLIRWTEGVLRPIPGWEKILLQGVTSFASPVRALHVWTDNAGTVRTGVLCEKHCYVLEGNELTDITPSGGMLGPADDLFLGGYGEGDFGVGTYGTPRPSTQHVTFASPWWSIDNWGQNLVFMNSYDGRLLQWVPNVSGGSIAAAVTGAPTNNRGFVIAPQDYLMLFGMGGNIRRFGWCSQRDITNWLFDDITSTAGFFDIEPSAYIIAAKTLRNGVLIFTNIGSFISQYIGVPFIFNYDDLKSAVVPVNPQSVITYTGKAAWYSGDSFWRFDGSTVVALPCSILDAIHQVINEKFVPYRMSGCNIGNKPEIWWHIPASHSSENTLCVIWNYKDNWWSMGTVSRTCSTDASFTGYPTMSDGVNLFLHEKGLFYPGADLPYVQSSDLNASSNMKTIGPFRADGLTSECTFEWITRENRSGNLYEKSSGPLTADANGLVSFQETGRAHFLKLATAADGLGNWSLGRPQVLQHDRGR